MIGRAAVTAWLRQRSAVERRDIAVDERLQEPAQVVGPDFDLRRDQTFLELDVRLGLGKDRNVEVGQDAAQML